MKVYGIAGWKNSGKTGLVTRLVAHFAAAGLRVSTVKHAHHAFDVDHPGRDSYRHREAGASEVCIASSQRVALLRELRDAPEPSLDEMLAMMSPVDLVLIEGFKGEDHPKVETVREGVERPYLHEANPSIRAVASDVTLDQVGLPQFDLNDTAAIARFIADELGLQFS